MLGSIKLSSVNPTLLTSLARLSGFDLSDSVDDLAELVKAIGSANPEATIKDLITDESFVNFVGRAANKGGKGHSVKEVLSDLLHAQVKCPVCDLVAELEKFAPNLRNKINSWKE